MVSAGRIASVVLFSSIALPTAAWAQPASRPASVELILHASAGTADPYPFHPAYELIPADPATYLEFNSGPFMTLTVPASAGSRALFFETTVQALYGRTSDTTRILDCALKLKVFSSLIPSNRVVRAIATTVSISEANVGGHYDLFVTPSRTTRYFKFLMQRGAIGAVDMFTVTDTTSNDAPVPDAEAVSLINQLIDKGFTLQASVIGDLQGIRALRIVPVTVEITRFR